MNIIRNIKKGIVLASMMLAAVPVCGQDLLADVAPVDKKMQSIDSQEQTRLVVEEQL